MTILSDDRMSPALEISIAYTPSQVTVELVGVLDGSTRGTFLTLMGDLILEGFQHLTVNIEQATVDTAGVSALTLCQQRVCELGGTLFWDGAVSFGPPQQDVSDSEVAAC